VSSTTGAVLFTDGLDNNFLAIDADDGKTLYRSNAGGSADGGLARFTAAEGRNAVRVAPCCTKEDHHADRVKTRSPR
jgi:hypothetical protein